jgi:hypothetical protein
MCTVFQKQYTKEAHTFRRPGIGRSTSLFLRIQTRKDHSSPGSPEREQKNPVNQQI